MTTGHNILYLMRQYKYKEPNCIAGFIYHNVFRNKYETLEPGTVGLMGDHNLALPAGEYKIALHKSQKWSPRRDKMLFNIYSDEPGNPVAKDRYILIHAGNKVEDTQGCILIGKRHKDKPTELIDSRERLRSLMKDVFNSINNHNIKIEDMKLIIDDSALKVC